MSVTGTPSRAPTFARGYRRHVTMYRFLDPMGDVMDERELPDHAAALAFAREDEELDDEIQRVEYLGPEGDWRWAGALEGR